MLKSMTGFGRAEVVADGRKLVLELKAVNHRFCEVVLRLPRFLTPLEDRIRRLIQGKLARGRIDGYFSVEEYMEKPEILKVDKALVAAYYRAMRELQENIGIAGEIRLEHLLNLPNIFLVEEKKEDLERWWVAVEEVTTAAINQLSEMRVAEGVRLQEDLAKRLNQIAIMVDEIEKYSPLVVEEYRERLKNRLSEWLKDGLLNQDRLALEAAIFAERCNITEEVIRLKSHLKQFKTSFSFDEQVGRKLDFLLQEMNREVNTIASRASDLKIGNLVIEIKSELEKMKEQVQNIE